MEEVNKNTELDKPDKKLHISDVSDSDFILSEIRTILKKKEEDMLWYIKEYFTKDEIFLYISQKMKLIDIQKIF